MAILKKSEAVAARVAQDITPLELFINDHLTSQRVIDYVSNSAIDNPSIRVNIDGATLTTPAVAALKASIEAAEWKDVEVVQEAKRVVVAFSVKPKVDVYVATVSPASPSMAVAGTVQLVVTVTKNGEPYSATPTYTSGTPAKATVSAGGLVTGVAVGTSVITIAEAGKYSITKTVTVTA